MTKLVTTITADSIAALSEKAAQAFGAGTDFVELRLDYLRPLVPADQLSSLLLQLPPSRWVITLRSAEEGGRSELAQAVRLSYLSQAINRYAGAMDFEYLAWRSVAGTHRKAFEPVGGTPAVSALRLILSRHDFGARPAQVRELIDEILAVYPNVVAKVAWRGEFLIDNIEAFAAMRAAPSRTIAIVMGEVGLASRVLAKKFGAAATYCALEEGAEAAPGQVPLAQMRTLYRWDSISASTRLFGVLGDPIAHSLSPRIFNRLFELHGVDAVYLPLYCPGGEPRLIEFLQACESAPWLDAGGFSVTLPHKESARRHVGDRADPQAALIGAVNTLCMRDGEFYGFNTDYRGALDALCAGLNTKPDGLRGMSVDVLGAGGAARAVVAGLVDCGCRVTLYNRDASRAEPLAGEFGCTAAPWEDRARGDGRVLVNCTSLGMFPHEATSPMPVEGLARRELVFDTVYNPVETRLLREAGDAACATISGVEMFARQAAEQYRIWFGDHPDVSDMRRTVLSALGHTPAEG